MAKRIYLDLTDEKSGVTGTSLYFSSFFPKKVYGVNGYNNQIDFTSDCGSFQGEDNDESLNSNFGYDVTKPEFSILTHAHLDHYGRYPIAISKGFQGPVFTTYVSKTFLREVFLADCLKIEKKRAKKLGTEPNYTELEIDKMLNYMVGCAYHKEIKYNDNIYLYFFDNGHVPGAAVTLVRLTCPGYEDINIIITGDYNDHNTFFKVNPLPEWVYQLPNLIVIIESTYGDKKASDLRPACFIKNVAKALANSQTVVVPAFSFVRTQEVDYALKEAQDNGIINPNIPIYNDGKTAIGCTSLFMQDEFKKYPHMKDFLPQNLTFVEDKELRKFVKHSPYSKIIVASSGMGSYGPSQSYIEAYCNNPNSIIHATGYVSPNSKLGELRESNIACGFFDTDEFSAHGKQDTLINFLKPFNSENLKQIIVTHGNPEVKEYFANVLRDTFDTKVDVLSNDTIFRITSDGIVAKIPRL